MNVDLVRTVLGTLMGLGSSSVFIVALFIGFCVIVGLTKLKKTTGGRVVKSLDEMITHKAFVYLPPTAPRGTVDQLHPPTAKL
jgi:hypothetical protein